MREGGHNTSGNGGGPHMWSDHETVAVAGLAWSPHAAVDPLAADLASNSVLMAAVRQSGEDTTIGRQLALALGIPVRTAEERIQARGKTLKLDGVLRGIVLPHDPALDYIVFIVETSGKTVYLLSTSCGGLKRAVVNDRTKIFELAPDDAETAYAREARYWRNTK